MTQAKPFSISKREVWDPRILKAGVIQGPLQQRNQRPLLVLAVGEVSPSVAQRRCQ
jgi:hypothetical protein